MIRVARGKCGVAIAIVTYLCRWAAIGWPQRIINQMEVTAVQHVEDEARFRKIQLVDQNNFDDQLDSLQVSGANHNLPDEFEMIALQTCS